MYRCHICGAPLEYPGRCPDCGERPVYDWLVDPELKKETVVNTKKENKDERAPGN